MDATVGGLTMTSTGSKAEAASGKVRTGDIAPDWTLPDKDGHAVRLADLLGSQAVVLFFYPKANTGGCTAEACAFRDSYEVFRSAGAEVVGISGDDPATLTDFAARNNLQFVLVSDSDNAVRKRYGATAMLGLMPGRVTYILDKHGVVRHVFASQLQFEKHVSELLRILDEIRAE